MQIDLTPSGVGDNEPHGAPVMRPDKAGIRESRDDIGFLVRTVHQVKVTVLSGLLPDQGVDAPTTANPHAEPSQRRKDDQHVVSRHHAAYVAPCRRVSSTEGVSASPATSMTAGDVV